MNRSLRLGLVAVAATTLMLLSGCGKKAPAEVVKAAPEGKAAPGANAGAAVKVDARGKNFDPPIEIATLPAGSWYCDMGKSHFARMDKGDATCPRCKMKLHNKK